MKRMGPILIIMVGLGAGYLSFQHLTGGSDSEKILSEFNSMIQSSRFGGGQPPIAMALQAGKVADHFTLDSKIQIIAQGHPEYRVESRSEIREAITAFARYGAPVTIELNEFKVLSTKIVDSINTESKLTIHLAGDGVPKRIVTLLATWRKGTGIWRIHSMEVTDSNEMLH